MAEYPALLTEAGLRLDELSNISACTRGTVPRLTENIRRHRREFEARHGVSLDCMVRVTTSPLGAADIGCLIAVAHRAPTPDP